MSTGNRQPDPIKDAIAARKSLESASTLHWFHWCIVTLSLLLTFFAWHYARSALQTRIENQFEREADQVVELVQERLQKYEDALWGGVALFDSSEQNIDFVRWKAYANSLHIESKYPGINGIGVIHALTEHGVPEYLARQRAIRPDFEVFPSHNRNERYPISYIVPVQGNEKAVGLDIAHETNRFTAAVKCRESGETQITGPITLVQDSGKTPGFLFYAPVFTGGRFSHSDDRADFFEGMVYAPIVVKNLMDGTLGKERRHVGLRLLDGEQVLYDEHLDSESDFDPDPLFKRSAEISLYGRNWTFDIWSAKSFRLAAADHQPLAVLIGGVFIDGLLMLLFISTSRASGRALRYADSMTLQLEANAEELRGNQVRLARKAKLLQQSNSELEQFAYVASHDLQEPLRKVSAFCQLLKEDYGERLDEEANTYIDYAVDGAKRMKTLISDLLSFSRISSKGNGLQPTNAAVTMKSVLLNLDTMIEETGASVTYDEMPMVLADESQLVQLLQNLIGNGIKYRDFSRTPQIHVGVEEQDGEWVFSVADNGIGIGQAYFEKVFEIFKRLHSSEQYSGTGIGLAICKRIVERWNGKIWLESEEGTGSTFRFTIKKVSGAMNPMEGPPLVVLPTSSIEETPVLIQA